MRGQYTSGKGFCASLLIMLVAFVWVLNAPVGRGLWANLAFLAFVALGLSIDRIGLRRL
jgi:hypothetical protein